VNTIYRPVELEEIEKQNGGEEKVVAGGLLEKNEEEQQDHREQEGDDVEEKEKSPQPDKRHNYPDADVASQISPLEKNEKERQQRLGDEAEEVENKKVDEKKKCCQQESEGDAGEQQNQLAIEVEESTADGDSCQSGDGDAHESLQMLLGVV